MTQNLFHALFTYRPREGLTPEENFLTEAFAHTLRANPDVCRAWIASVMDIPPSALRGVPKVETQTSFTAPDGKSWLIPDMVVRCDCVDGQITVLSEHKWKSSVNLDQLARYVQIAESVSPSCVVLIAPTVMQVAEALQAQLAQVKTIRWQDVHAFLQKSDRDGVLELVEFLALQGLASSKPLSWPKLAAYASSRSVEMDCLRLSYLLEHLILAGFDAGEWSFLPSRFLNTRVVPKRWGRVGVELHDGQWPGLFLGFLLDGADHKLTLVAQDTSIDLMLALDADPKLIVDKVLEQRSEALRMVGVDVMYGAEFKNKWRKVVVREPLAETIRAKLTDEDQVEAIYARLLCWCESLFSHGELCLLNQGLL